MTRKAPQTGGDRLSADRISRALRLLAGLAGALLLAHTPSAHALDHGLYADLLTKHTREVDDLARVRVDYARLRNNPEWEKLVVSLARTEPAALETEREKLAFWINAYNILAIDIVVQNYPVDSIKDIGSFFRPVWDRAAGRIAGQAYTLGQIEHEILRPMGEPRIHGAIVCASLSCPPLLREPFRAATLDTQLDAHIRSWLSDTRKGVRIDTDGETVVISKIFDWFEEDFATGGGVLAFISEHLDDERRRQLSALGTSPELEYLDYDWSLNRVN